jgi:hypothetical protein
MTVLPAFSEMFLLGNPGLSAAGRSKELGDFEWPEDGSQYQSCGMLF